MKKHRKVNNEKYKYPIILDRYSSAGRLDRHYFLQDIYVAKK